MLLRQEEKRLKTLGIWKEYSECSDLDLIKRE